MMGAAMLKHHRFVQSLWGWPKCVRRGVRRSPCRQYKIKVTPHQACMFETVLKKTPLLNMEF